MFDKCKIGFGPDRSLLADILTALQVFREKEAEQVVFGTLCQIRRLHFFHVLDGKLASLC